MLDLIEREAAIEAAASAIANLRRVMRITASEAVGLALRALPASTRYAKLERAVRELRAAQLAERCISPPTDISCPPLSSDYEAYLVAVHRRWAAEDATDAALAELDKQKG